MKNRRIWCVLLFSFAMVCVLGSIGLLNSQVWATELGALRQELEVRDTIEEISEWKDIVRRNILQEGGLASEDMYPQGNKMQIMNYSSGVGSERQLEEELLLALKERKTIVDLRVYQIDKDEFIQRFSCMMNSHPELFYLDTGSCIPRYYPSTNEMLDVQFVYYWEEEECCKRQAEFEAAINLALRGMEDSFSDFEKALYINDYLCENITYDSSFSYYDAYHGLVEGLTVCQGYSLAFQAIADRVGLESQMVTSISLNHAWNMVKMDGRYYHIDSTWDDSEYDEGSDSHYYFLRSTYFFENNNTVGRASHRTDDYVIMGDWLMSYARYTEYDGKNLWNEGHSTYNHVNGKWYTYDDTDGRILAYQYESGQLVLKAEKKMESYLTPSGRKVYFSSLGEYRDNIYYSHGREGIYEWNPARDEETLIYQYPEELKANQGYMVYMNLDAYGQLSFIYFDGKDLRKVENAARVDTSDYKISYVLKGGELPYNERKSYQTSLETLELPVPWRDNSVFLGWYLEPDYQTQVKYIPRGSFGDKTFYAKWYQNYKIKYKLNGGKNNGKNPKNYTEFTETIRLKNPTRKGYQFKGWYTSNLYHKKVTKIPKGSTGNKTFYAKWVKKKK